MFDKQHPLRIFLILLLFVFMTELSIMYLLAVVQIKPAVDWTEAFVDAATLTSLCVPFFWFVVVRPLQKTLELEHIKAHKILEMAAEGVITIDVKGTILAFNRAAQKIFGYSEAEILGKNVSILMTPQHRGQHQMYIDDYLKSGNSHVIGQTREIEARRKSGLPFPIEISVSEIDLGDTHVFTAMLRDISEQKLAMKRIEQLAHYDELTHLPNRSLFYDRLGQAIMIAKRNQHGLTLMFVDLDGFKQVNDAMGHHSGDLLLAKVAGRLRLCVRESDTLARLGGDEFTILLNDTGERETLVKLAEKIIESIRQPFDLDGHAVNIGASIGIARYPDDATTSGTLLIVADKAMYAAKAAGKGTYRFGAAGDATAAYQVMERG